VVSITPQAKKNLLPLPEFEGRVPGKYFSRPTHSLIVVPTELPRLPLNNFSPRFNFLFFQIWKNGYIIAYPVKQPPFR
jgi:hypothetical protein